LDWTAKDKPMFGYPTQILTQAVRVSNGLLGMTGQQLLILTDDPRHYGTMTALYEKFADCLGVRFQP
jgi:hypothetical protein